MPPAPELAKLSRPRLYRVSARERVFRALDELREYPLVWVTGAPGAGKSSAVASWLEVRKLASIWYHVDPGDADPATFFHYLGGALPARGARGPLPLFADEYRRDLPGFTRRWFREFFARMTPASVLVLDDFHDARTGHTERAALAAGLEEIPAGITVVALSRGDPPAEFARLAARRAMGRVGAEALRFTRDEAAVLLRAAGEADERAIDRVWERVDGWAAGLVLLHEHAAARGRADNAGTHGRPEAVFKYFAGEILNSAAPEVRRAAMVSALLPHMSVPVVAALTGHPKAGRLLEDGYRRRLFVTRRDAREPVYEYHALFREFLLDQLRAKVAPEELARLRRRAAELLEDDGANESAAELYREAGDWANAVRLTLADAPAMIAQGRMQTLADRLAALPPAEREREPWLAYWEGLARVNIEPLTALATLEQAYQGFLARGDKGGQIQAAEAAIGARYLAWEDWRPILRWIDILEQLLAGAPTFGSPEAEARALSALAVGLTYCRPGHPMLAACVNRLETLLDAVADKNGWATAATRLLDALIKTGDHGAAQRVADRLRTALEDPEMRPLAGAWARLWLSSRRFWQARFDDCAALVDEAQRIAEEQSLGFLLPVILLARGYVLAVRRDAEALREVIGQLAATPDPARKVEGALLHTFESSLAALQGDLPTAEGEARTAVALALETGSRPVAFLCNTGLLLALDAAGRRAEFRSVLERMQALAAGVRGGWLRFNLALWEAYLLHCEGADGFREPLAEALGLGRREGYFHQHLGDRRMSRLCAAALDASMETEYVRQLVARRGLAPPEDRTPEHWPWPLRLRTLGRFEIARDGAALEVRGKAQKKPLELLRALVALGSEGVDASRLAALLWPDVDGDAAKASFDTTLYRLRKLLALDSALLLAEGKLSLDRRQCWVDVWAFERIVREADARAQAAGATAEEVVPLGRALLDAYPGHFLAGDEDCRWAMDLRDRLRSKLVRTVLGLGNQLQATGRWNEAVTLYQRTLELDNLTEALYRGVMICHRELGQPAAALQAYRRCRELLSVVLGLAPSAETEAVRRSLEPAS
jgi:ATP/maltotriose-dependent transcriptional regulator MalT/DNA-binding SARP family transcriptional activator